MHFVKDLYEDNDTDHLHNKFIRYSKGGFVGPIMKIRVSNTGVKIGASFHYVDELLEIVAGVIGKKVVHISGLLIWNRDLASELAKLGIMYSKVSKARGIFKYKLENDVDIKDFVETMNSYHVLINIREEGVSYVTKSSFPKPNKEFAADFCKVTLPSSIAGKVIREFAFDVSGEPKLVEIFHEIEVTGIELPKEVPDFDTARRLAKRVGTIKRKVCVDGKEVSTQRDFNV